MNFLQLTIQQQANPEGLLPGAFRIRAFSQGGDAMFPEYNGPDSFVPWPDGAPFATYRVVAEYKDANGDRFGPELDVQVQYSAPGAPATLPVPTGAVIGPM